MGRFGVSNIIMEEIKQYITTPEKSWVEVQMIEADKKWQKRQQDMLDEIFDGRYLEYLNKGVDGKPY